MKTLKNILLATCLDAFALIFDDEAVVFLCDKDPGDMF